MAAKKPFDGKTVVEWLFWVVLVVCQNNHSTNGCKTVAAEKPWYNGISTKTTKTTLFL
jgi:hypothetical protein